MLGVPLSRKRRGGAGPSHHDAAGPAAAAAWVGRRGAWGPAAYMGG